MGEVVEYSAATIPLDSLPTLLQINGEFPSNGFVTPTAYTTQDGETILILPNLPQFSTLVLTGEGGNGVPIQQIVTVHPENGQTLAISQNGVISDGEGFVVPTSNEHGGPTIVNLGELSKRSGFEGANLLILPQAETSASVAEQQSVEINIRGLGDSDLSRFLQEDSRYHCDRCDSVFDRPRQMKRHMDDHKKEKPWKCRSCTASFNVERNLLLHEASHNLTPNSSCPLCEKRFLRIAGLCSHLRIHQVDDTVVCDLCKAEFDLQSELEEHLLSSHSGQPHVQLKLQTSLACRQCNVLFADASQFRKHMAEHRVIEKSVRPMRPRRSRGKHVATFPVADAAFQTVEETASVAETSDAVEALTANHDPIVPPAKKNEGRSSLSNTCTECGKAFRSKMLLDRHILIHTGEKPFACDQCDKSFNQKAALNLHKLCHSGEKPHHCQFCFASFTQRGNLRAHIKSCHRVPQDISTPGVYRCQMCSCSFRRLSTYNAHLTLRHVDAATPSASATVQKQPRKRQRIVLPLKPAQLTIVRTGDADTGEQPPLVRVRANSAEPLNGAINCASVEQTGTVGPDTMATSDELLYSYLPINNGPNNAMEVVSSFETSNVEVASTNAANVEVIEESFEGVEVKDPITNTVQNHRVIRANGVIYHCCSVCDKRFRKTNDFVRHMRIHRLEKPFVCGSCGNRFTNKSTLDSHMHVHAGPTAKRFRCHVCRKMFSSSSSLKVHLRLHTGHRPFSCNICDMKFRTSSSRRTHMLKHQKNKQLILQRGTTPQQPMETVPSIQHLYVRDHDVTGITDYPVSSLEASTVISDDITVETPSISYPSSSNAILPARKYMCHFCPKAYKKSDHLRYHLESAHGSGLRSFICQVCGKSFAMFAVLRNHLRTHAKHDLVGNHQGDTSGFSSYERSLLQHASLRTQQPNEIVEQGTDGARFDLVSMSAMQQLQQPAQQLIPSSPNMLSRMDGIATNDLEDFNSIAAPVDYICFHCGQGFQSEDLVRAHVNIEHQDAMPGRNNLSSRNQSHGVDHLLDPGQSQPAVDRVHSNNNAVQSWIPTNDVLPELSLSLLPPSSVVDAEQPETGGDDSLLIESTADEASHIDAVHNLLGTADERDEDGPGLLEQLAARQECPTVIIAGNMPQQPPPMMPPQQPDIETLKKTAFKSRGVARCVVAHFHPNTSSFEFRCSICGAQFYTKQSISRHVTDMHTAKQTFACSTCNRQLASASSLLLHSTRCAGKQVVLGHPAADIPSTSTVLVHEQPGQVGEIVEHALTYQTVPPDSSKPHACKFCSRSFAKPSDLVRHERTHTGDRPFRCDQCGRSFRLKSALVGHQLTHLPADERSTFTCHLCKAKLGSRTSLVVHLRRHTGAAPYHCPHCSEKFATAGRRQSHVLTAHINSTQSNAQMDGSSLQH